MVTFEELLELWRPYRDLTLSAGSAGRPLVGRRLRNLDFGTCCSERARITDRKRRHKQGAGGPPGLTIPRKLEVAPLL